MLNDIFSAFDDEVMRFKLFKYHHVFNTYIVASPSAALWHTAHKVSEDIVVFGKQHTQTHFNTLQRTATHLVGIYKYTNM